MLGVFIDAEYAEVDGHVLTGEITRPFLDFAGQVAEHAAGLVLLGRAADPTAAGLQPVDRPARVVTVPAYPSLRSLGRVAATLPEALRRTWTWTGQVDVAWVFGPHPIALAAVVFGRVRGRRVVLGVRQDTMRYFRSRLPSRRWLPVLAPLWVMDAFFRLAGRMLPVTAVGPDLARQYGHPRARVLPMTVSLMRTDDLVDAPPPRHEGEPVRLLTVGRLAPEKTPEVLVDALAMVRARTAAPWQATWVGSGPLADRVAKRAHERGLGDRFVLAGQVPFGPGLVSRYRDAHVFVHTAVTEGVPQVLVEAMASGCAIVATDVGGVSALLDGGRLGRLVPPHDPSALADAVAALLNDDDARLRLAEAALAAARTLTREGEGARVAAFVLGGAT